MNDLIRYMFERAHSGNVNMLRNAEDRWRGLDIRPNIVTYTDPMTRKFHAKVSLVNYITREVFHSVDFSDYPHINDGDVFCVKVGSWLNHRYNEYRTWV